MNGGIGGWVLAGILILTPVQGPMADSVGEPYVPDTNTVALYHLDEGSGTTVNDATGQSHNGTLYGGGNRWVSSAKYGGGLQTAADQPGGFDVPIWFSGQTFSVEGWFKPESVSGEIYLFGGKGSSDENVFYVRQNGASFAWGIFDPGSQEWREMVGGSIAAGAWYHVAVTARCSGNDITMSLYQDGILKNNVTFSFVTLPGVVTTLKVGRCLWSDYGSYFCGQIDEVRISGTVKVSKVKGE